MTYTIRLSYNNDAEYFDIPVLPESIKVTGGSNGKTYDIVGQPDTTEETRAGEINVIKGPKLREITFSSIFPATRYPFVSSEKLLQPMQYVEAIRRWQYTKHPIRFRYYGNYFETTAESVKDINIPASIEKFEWSEVAGSPGEIEYTITLKEYVFYAARLVAKATGPNGQTTFVQQPAARPDERIRPTTYTLVNGDTLSIVSRKLLGDSGRWREIQKLNGITDAQLLTLQVGRVLQIPGD